MNGLYVIAAGTLILIACFALWSSGKFLTAKQDRWVERVAICGFFMLTGGGFWTLWQLAILEGWWT